MDEYPASNEELLGMGECPQSNCVEAAGHTGPCSGDLSYDALRARVARLEGEKAAKDAALKEAVKRLHKIEYSISNEHSIDPEDCRAPVCVAARAALSDTEGCETCGGRKWIPVYDIPPRESSRAASGTTQPCPDCAALEGGSR